MRRHAYTLFLSALAVILMVSMVFYPDLAFRSAVHGLRIWWDVVFPALLPFFVGGQVLMALGVVRFMGVLMEPFMRPLFGVPGVGSFVVAMGLASGYPIGSVLTAQLRRDGHLTRTEAERLMSFTNTADPLFMAGAVAVGMFGSPALAGIIMAAHYLGALCTGICLKFYRRGDPPTPNPMKGRGSVLARALTALVEARTKDGRPFGQVMGDAVRESVNTLLLIGGFIILFSVIIQLLGHMGVVAWATSILGWAAAPLGFGREAVGSLISGFFEITIGAQVAAHAAAPLLERLVLVNMIIAWSGLSVLGQVAAVTQGTEVSMLPYVVSRVLHALFAGVITLLLWNPALEGPATRVMAPAWGPGGWLAHVSWTGMFEASAAIFGGVLAALAVALALWSAWQGLRVAMVRLRP